MAIKFFFSDVSFKLSSRKFLKEFITSIFKGQGRELSSINFIFCTDEYLLNINREFLNHTDYTDIITFRLSDPGDPIVGEIYISAERVIENSKKFGASTQFEFHRIIFHGVLHLCGYKDKTPPDKTKMTAAEDKYLALYFSKI